MSAKVTITECNNLIGSVLVFRNLIEMCATDVICVCYRKKLTPRTIICSWDLVCGSYILCCHWGWVFHSLALFHTPLKRSDISASESYYDRFKPLVNSSWIKKKWLSLCELHARGMFLSNQIQNHYVALISGLSRNFEFMWPIDSMLLHLTCRNWKCAKVKKWIKEVSFF